MLNNVTHISLLSTQSFACLMNYLQLSCDILPKIAVNFFQTFKDKEQCNENLEVCNKKLVVKLEEQVSV